MKRIVLLFLLFSVTLGVYAQENLMFIVASDMGRRGVSQQQNVANIMGHFAEQNRIAFLAVAGDPIHDRGVKSVDDGEWNVKIENVYTAPALHNIPWYVVSGNHEYNGNVQAIIDYSQKSERWNAPARYFSVTKKINNSEDECLFLFIDTAPFINRYRSRGDVAEQDIDEQKRWIENQLASSSAKWKIVIGHHPVYANTTKSISERTDMQTHVGVTLEKFGADVFICGHIHNFQHLKPAGKNMHYIVNSSAAEWRRVSETEGTIFTAAAAGFTVCSISENEFTFFFISHEDKEIYRYTIRK